MGFISVLLAILLFSYGQILGMGVWQDDNGLFFKLAHIGENTGYLSAGPFGSGPYKYIATPYIPIYHFFGYNTVAYFLLTFGIYFCTTIVVYNVYKRILGKRGGRVAAILYAAGYIASDGFIRLFNSVVTSVSVVTISLFFLSYWNYLKKLKIRWYALSLSFYFLSVELARGRTHYLIGIVFLFEILYIAKKKISWKAFLNTFLRVIPFTFIFWKYFVLHADQRSAGVGNFIAGVLKGDFHLIYGFVSSVANVFVPDWTTSFLYRNFSASAIWVFFLTLTGVIIFYIHRKNRKLAIGAGVLLLIWMLASRSIFNVLIISPSEYQIITAFLGGWILIVMTALPVIIEEKYRRMYILLLFWTVLNVAAYAAYNPLVVYESINRYLAHSFFAVTGLFAILYIGVKKGRLGLFVKLLVFCWGIGNLFSAFTYQRNVLAERSYPAAKFYSDLKLLVPEVSKNDIFYFDVADDARGYFADAFSVASMPETTALAWRYGVDRYDIYRNTNIQELVNTISKNSLNAKNLHSFYYSKEGLLDTTSAMVQNLFTKTNATHPEYKESQEGSGIIFNFDDLKSVSPIRVNLSIQANVNYSSLTFPLGAENLTLNNVYISTALRNESFSYEREKKNFYKNAKINVNNVWMDATDEKIDDNNVSTFWRAHRVEWGKGIPATIDIDLGKVEEIDSLVWINTYAANSPTQYSVETSVDNNNWKKVKTVDLVRRLNPADLQIEKFDKTNARFVRMEITKSLSSDSPAISEIWVVPAEFDDLNIIDAENFLKSPLAYVQNKEDFINTIRLMNYTGTVNVSWVDSTQSAWQKTSTSKIAIAYDGTTHQYSIDLPVRGSLLKALKIDGFQIPGDVTVNGISVRHLSLDELVKEYGTK